MRELQGETDLGVRDHPFMQKQMVGSDLAAPTVITPGSVQPGIGTGRSSAPVASNMRRAETVSLWPSPVSDRVPSGSMCQTTVAGRYRTVLPRKSAASFRPAR